MVGLVKVAKISISKPDCHHVERVQNIKKVKCQEGGTVMSNMHKKKPRQKKRGSHEKNGKIAFGQ